MTLPNRHPHFSALLGGTNSTLCLFVGSYVCHFYMSFVLGNVSGVILLHV